jgi:transposase
MDLDASGDKRAPFQFTGRQQLIYDSLTRKSQGTAELYESALRVYWDEGNPSRILLAAHSIREITKNLPKVLQLPVDTGRLGDHVNALEKVWKKATKSECHQEGKWTGNIDEPLRNLLKSIAELFVWKRENRVERRVATAKMFRSIDPSGMSLPQSLEEERTDGWLDLQDYFIPVAHGKPTTREEFAAKLETLERILVDSLHPTPSVDLSAIDRILEEGAGDA